MKKAFFILLILLTFGLLAQAQNISVKDFYLVENDLTARLQGTSVEDQNGYLCALIKVRTIERGIWAFDVGMLGVTKTEMQNTTHPAEIWVYVPFGVTRMTIQHEKLGILDKWPFPCNIEKGCTYIMELTTGKVITVVEEDVHMQYLAFQITPPNALLLVNDELWEVGADGTAMKFVDFGTYIYRVQASNYHTEVGKVVVNDLEKAHKVNVSLKPDFVEVTLKVDADAEIWVNDEKKGTRSWTGPLGKGSYKLECKQAGHETTMTTQKITADMQGQTITLPAPVPVYGSLNVESTPFATLYIDGKAIGETPMFVKEILVGEHEVKLVKEGWVDHVETIVIQKGIREQMKVRLDNNENDLVVNNKKQKEVQPSSIGLKPQAAPSLLPKGSYLYLSGYSNSIEASVGKQITPALMFAGGVGLSFPSVLLSRDSISTGGTYHIYRLFADAMLGTPGDIWSFYAKLRMNYSLYGDNYGHNHILSTYLSPGVRYKNVSLEVGNFGYRIGLSESVSSKFVYGLSYRLTYVIPLKTDDNFEIFQKALSYKATGHYLRLAGGSHYMSAAYAYRFSPMIMADAGLGTSFDFGSSKTQSYGYNLFADMVVNTPRDAWSFFVKFRTNYHFSTTILNTDYSQERDVYKGFAFVLVPGVSYKNLGIEIGDFGYSIALTDNEYNGFSASVLSFSFVYDIPVKVSQ